MMARFEMRPFVPAEAETIAHWATTPDDMWRLTGSHEFPLTAAQVVVWNYEASYTFTLRREGDLVAYGEIIEDEVDNDVEIQHLMVAPDMRRQGCGQAMLSRLCAFLAASRSFEEVWARVGRDNNPALHTAEAVGFQEDVQMSGERYRWLKKSLTRLSPEEQGDSGA
jgi:RimJ/RimL family protein N-acetyltransferase